MAAGTDQRPTLVVTARTRSVLLAFERHFCDARGVEIADGDIVSIPGLDAVVSPANAYGWMDGGVDAVYLCTFGKQLEERVQERIKREHAGRMPVGAAFVIATHHERIPNLVVAPTMRFPGPIRGTRNPYLAMKAALEAVLAFNATADRPIRRLGCPGLGTGTGEIPAEEAARQMRQAHSEVFGPKS